MVNYEPPAPRYWKALLVTLVFLTPISLISRTFVHIPNVIWGLLSIGAALVISFGVHLRMQNDWRAKDTMAALDFYQRTSGVKRFHDRR